MYDMISYKKDFDQATPLRAIVDNNFDSCISWVKAPSWKLLPCVVPKAYPLL